MENTTNTTNSYKDRDLFMRFWAYLAHTVTSHLLFTSQGFTPVQAGSSACIFNCYWCSHCMGKKMVKNNKKAYLSSEKVTFSVATDNIYI